MKKNRHKICNIKYVDVYLSLHITSLRDVWWKEIFIFYRYHVSTGRLVEGNLHFLPISRPYGTSDNLNRRSALTG